MHVTELARLVQRMRRLRKAYENGDASVADVETLVRVERTVDYCCAIILDATSLPIEEVVGDGGKVTFKGE